MPLPLFQLSTLAISACLVVALWTRRRRERQRLPPGPPGSFLLGNVSDVPRPPEEWKGFAAFGRLYGEQRGVTTSTRSLNARRPRHVPARAYAGRRRAEHDEGRHGPAREAERDLLGPPALPAGERSVRAPSVLWRSRARTDCRSIGFDWLAAGMPYGPRWREHRRALTQQLNEAAARRLWDMHGALNARFLALLADAPHAWWDLTRWSVRARRLRGWHG